MSPGGRMILGALADFIATVSATVAGAMVQAGQVVMPGPAVWILGVLTGAGLAASHVKAALAEPPR